MERPVFIILVNYNGHDHTTECLESLGKLKCDNYNLIIVDNSESDGSLNILLSWLAAGQGPHQLIPESGLLGRRDLQKREILLIRQRQNKGFAAANNKAMEFLSVNDIGYSHLWLLNNDTVVDADSLSELILFDDLAGDDVGVIGSKLLLYNDSSRIQAVGGRYNPWFGMVSEIGAGELDLGQYDNGEVKFDYVVGASMFVRKKFIEKVGLMSEDFFIYFEELDWALRGNGLGFKSAFCYSSKILHKGGASINSEGGKSLLSDFYFIRNRLVITKRYFPNALWSVYLALVLSILKRVIRGEYSKLRYLLAAIRDPSKKLSDFSS